MERRNFIKLFSTFPILGVLDFPLFWKNESVAEKQPKDLKDRLLRIMSDVQLGDHVVIGSRPSVEKSAIALNLLSQIGVQNGVGSVYFSLDRSKESVISQWIAIESGLPHDKIKNGSFTEKEIVQVSRVSDFISNSTFYIDDSASISVEEICESLVKLKTEKSNIKYVFIDFIQLVKSENKFDNRRDQMKDILSKLKLLAKEQNIVVISLSQLNRGTDDRSGNRPVLNNLREINDYSSIDKIILAFQNELCGIGKSEVSGLKISSLEFITVNLKKGQVVI